MKIKLFCRLTTDLDQALISIFTIQELPGFLFQELEEKLYTTELDRDHKEEQIR